MNLRTPLLLTAIYSLSAAAAVAANKWEDMDYGRFLSATYLNAEGKSTLDDKGCSPNKGIAVKLGKQDAEATLLFDTELLRMAGGWTGGWLKLKGVVFDGGHGPNSEPADGANIYFQTNPGPGWSKGDDLKDPRKLPDGPRRGEGALRPAAEGVGEISRALSERRQRRLRLHRRRRGAARNCRRSRRPARQRAAHADIQRPRARRRLRLVVADGGGRLTPHRRRRTTRSRQR